MTLFPGTLRWVLERPLGRVLGLVLILALTACTASDQREIPADSVAEAAGGGEDETDGGLGGTGILGVITGFGSIHVNGLRLLHDVDAPVASVIGDSPVTTLETGEVLLALAQDTEEGLFARRLVRYLPLVGPVTALDLDTKEIRVLGVTVQIHDDALIRDRSGAPLALAKLPLRARVAVSGFWNDTRVVAHHLRLVDPSLPDSLTGPVSIGAEGGLRIGGVAVATAMTVPPGTTLALTATGMYRDQTLTAETIGPRYATPLAPGVGSLSVQGYPRTDASGARLSGQPRIAVDPDWIGAFGLFEGAVTGLSGLGRRASALPDAPRATFGGPGFLAAALASLRGELRDRLDVSRIGTAPRSRAPQAPPGVLSGAAPGTRNPGSVGPGVLGSAPRGIGANARDRQGQGLGEGLGQGIGPGPGQGLGSRGPGPLGRDGPAGLGDGSGPGQRSGDTDGPGDTASSPGAGRGGPGAGPAGGRGGPGSGPAGGRGGPGSGPAGGRGGPGGGPGGGRGGRR
ncbi:MAG: DUF5666 domain-containing protein [Pseudomonadota bacterium]